MRKWIWLTGVVVVLFCILVLTGCLQFEMGNLR